MNAIEVYTAARDLEEACRRQGFTLADYVCLSLLADGPLTMRRLAAKMAVTPGAATNRIDRLIDRDLVTRERTASDRRVVTVSLTTMGSEILRRVSSAVTSP